jgi:Cu(I)/Ag(I) efflux system protein CusF
MKAISLTVFLVFAAGTALAQSGSTKGMDTKEMDHSSMSKADKGQATHKATGVVKGVDKAAGTVTLAHEAVKSMNWPAMTMTFKAQDKAMLDKAATGKKVEIEFQQIGKDYIITSLK